MEVLRLDGSLGGNVSLEAWWMVLSGDGKRMLFAKKSNFTEAWVGKIINHLLQPRVERLVISVAKSPRLSGLCLNGRFDIATDG